MATRFVNITDDDVEIFIEGEENENTRKKTRQDISLIVSFIASEKQTNESFEIEQLSPEELDGHLSKFLLAVRKKNGDEFEPTTLRGFLSSVERYRKKRRYSESILTGQHFATTRGTLASRSRNNLSAKEREINYAKHHALINKRLTLFTKRVQWA